MAWDWEAYLRSGYQVPNQIPEELVQSQNPAILHRDNHLSQNGGSSVINPINLSHSIQMPNQNQMPYQNQMLYQNAQFVSGDINIRAYSNSTPSGFTFDESSLITDGNSSLSVGSYFNNINNSTEGSPASNCAISGSPAGNQFSAQNQNSQEYQNGLRLCKRQGESLSNPVPTPQLVMSMYQAPVSPMLNLKRPRLEIRQEGLNSVQQPPQFPMQLRSYNSEQAASSFMQQNSLPSNQQHIVPSLINPQRIQINSMPNSQQLPVESQNAAALRGSVYAHQLMCYVNHQKHRPPDNNIGFWRKFVAEYYSPAAKRRWCLSKYENVGRQSLSVVPPPSMDSWTCDLCRSISAKGFVATYEALPRLKKAFFDTGAIDELLYVDYPSERRLPSGCMVLKYSKAVQQTVYMDFRAVHEGQLRVVFTPQLKIISWEFCVQHHEEIVPRRLVAPQVKELVQNAVRCHLDFETKGTNEVPKKDLLSNCNRIQAAGQELAKKLELPIVNELGFSRKVVRCLQMNEVFDCMKDLMSYSLRRNLSPTESLKRYPAEVVNAKLKMKEMELQSHMLNSQAPPPGFHMPNNFVLQTSNPVQQPSFSENPHQRLAMKQPIIDQPSFVQPSPQQIPPYIASSSSNPIPCGPHNYKAGPSRKHLVGPSSSSSQQVDQQDHYLNDLLRIMRDEGAFGYFVFGSKDAKGKSRIIYDPNGENPQVVFSQVRSTDQCEGSGAGAGAGAGGATGKREKGKGVNASSSSDSNRVSPEKKVIKREPDLEEDFTSPSHAQGASKKNGEDRP